MTQPFGPLPTVSREFTVSVRVVRGLLDAVEQAGVPRIKLLRAAKLEPEQLDAADARMPRWAVYRLCELATVLTNDPALGLHWSERSDGAAFTPISHLMAHAPTLRHAFESLSRFQRLLSDRCGYQLCEQGDKVTVRCLSLPGESLPTQRFVSEMIVTGLFRLVRFFNAQARLDRVSFAYAAPTYEKEYTRVFDSSERFDEPFTGLVFDRALMSASSPHQDEDLHDALRSVVERRVLRLTQCTPYAQRVRDVLLQQEAPQRSDMKTVARWLGLSVRSLRRRLDSEDTSYNAILNDACAIVAKRLLLDKQRTIQETAYELGFSDTTTFHRAFKRWTGMTPSLFRKYQLGLDTQA